MTNPVPKTQEMAQAIAKCIKSGERISCDGITLDTFRDCYNLLRGDDSAAAVFWLLVFLEDQVLAQPLGRPDVTLVIREERTRDYSSEDFGFITNEFCAMFGTVNGKYQFASFVKDIVTHTNLVLGAMVWVGCFKLCIDLLRPDVIQNLSSSLIASMSIFITIFVLLVLSVDPNTEYRYLETDRFHKLAKSDTYIAVIGVLSLVAAIVASALTSAYPSPSDGALQFEIRALLGAAFSTAVLGTLASFWLVLKYHFTRRHQLTAMLMAKNLVQNQQTLFADRTRKN